MKTKSYFSYASKYNDEMKSSGLQQMKWRTGYYRQKDRVGFCCVRKYIGKVEGE